MGTLETGRVIHPKAISAQLSEKAPDHSRTFSHDNIN